MSFYKLLGHITWVVTGCAALHIGAVELGHNILSNVTSEHMRIINLGFGLFGVLSLVMFGMMFMCCSSDRCPAGSGSSK
jgi:hypothetical protein